MSETKHLSNKELEHKVKTILTEIENVDYKIALDRLHKDIVFYPHISLMNMIGYIYFKNGDYERAQRIFIEILQADPTHEQAKNNYVESLLNMPNVDDADLRYGLGFVPECGQLWIKLANSYKQQNSPVEELNILQLATKILPNNIEIHKMLGNLYFRCSHIKDSMDEYAKVLQLSHNDSEATEMLVQLSHIPQKTVINIGVVMMLYRQFQEISDGVFIGSQASAANLIELKKYNITHVLNLTPDVSNFYEDSQNITLTYLRVPMLDILDFDITSNDILDSCVEFIDRVVKSGGKILVHCQAGISRSGTMVVAYVAKHDDITPLEALKKVQSIRSCVCPNEGFMRQLNFWI